MIQRRGVHVVLGAIRPDQDAIDADVLTYPYLRHAAASYNLPSFLIHSTPGLIQHRQPLDFARWREDFRAAYLMTAMYRLQKAWAPPTKYFWSSQVTAGSSRLYGHPLRAEVSKIAHEDLRFFEHLAEDFPAHTAFFEPVLAAYRMLVTQRIEAHPSLEARFAPLLEGVRELVIATEREAFQVFDTIAPGEQLSPSMITEKFSLALTVLQKQDSDWKKWKVVMNNSAKLCVDTKRHTIVVGKRRAPVPERDIRGLFAHEILVHAGRKVRGSKLSRELGDGLPGQVMAEEGLGVLIESAVNGHVPLKIKDRYIDIALAMGTKRRRGLTRAELFEFCYSRAVLRAIASEQDVSLESVEKITWEHVNRIYRGSLGNQYIGVFTRDVAYYKGFIKIAKYLERRRQAGKLKASLIYTMQARFDPTNSFHRQQIPKTGKR